MKNTKDIGHVYVVGEIGDTVGPVKIGIHAGSPCPTGRPGLNAGNPRTLRALGHLPVALEDMRWTEWQIHRRLRRHHVRGEWFDVRALNELDDWPAFLEWVLEGIGSSLHPFDLGRGDHILTRVRQVTDTRRHFIASCSSCGEIDGGPKRSLPTVLRDFVRHAGVDAGHAQLTELQVQAHHAGFGLGNGAAQTSPPARDADFSAGWWGSQGFGDPKPVLDLDRLQVPTDPGVYVVMRITSDQPDFVPESCGGHFKGRSPSVSPDILQRRWIDGVDTLYIGKAANLRRRIGSLSSFGRGAPVGHWGGRYLWQLADVDRLVVCWKALVEDPRSSERELIADFEAAFGRKPFANIAS